MATLRYRRPVGHLPVALVGCGVGANRWAESLLAAICSFAGRRVVDFDARLELSAFGSVDAALSLFNLVFVALLR